MKNLESKEFNNKADAVQFCKDNKGSYEGPFIDDNLNKTWVVFYFKQDITS